MITEAIRSQKQVKEMRTREPEEGKGTDGQVKSKTDGEWDKARKWESRE